MYHQELYRCFLFREMSREKIDSILGLLKGRIKSYQKNEIVISEESEVRDVGVLLSGEMCKVRYFSDGTEQMVQKLQEKRDHFSADQKNDQCDQQRFAKI